ncbi:hypothetical protein J7M23_07605, partial [Candidatus Sumerlaeota bacterium]|nr:hypothetical protein [Candidatus Sumerlaeota bacterium]
MLKKLLMSIGGLLPGGFFLPFLLCLFLARNEAFSTEIMIEDGSGAKDWITTTPDMCYENWRGLFTIKEAKSEGGVLTLSIVTKWLEEDFGRFVKFFEPVDVSKYQDFSMLWRAMDEESARFNQLDVSLVVENINGEKFIVSDWTYNKKEMFLCVYGLEYQWKEFFESEAEVTNPETIPPREWQILKFNIYKRLAEQGATSYLVKNISLRLADTKRGKECTYFAINKKMGVQIKWIKFSEPESPIPVRKPIPQMHQEYRENICDIMDRSPMNIKLNWVRLWYRVHNPEIENLGNINRITYDLIRNGEIEDRRFYYRRLGLKNIPETYFPFKGTDEYGELIRELRQIDVSEYQEFVMHWRAKDELSARRNMLDFRITVNNEVGENFVIADWGWTHNDPKTQPSREWKTLRVNVYKILKDKGAHSFRLVHLILAFSDADTPPPNSTKFVGELGIEFDTLQFEKPAKPLPVEKPDENWWRREIKRLVQQVKPYEELPDEPIPVSPFIDRMGGRLIRNGEFFYYIGGNAWILWQYPEKEIEKCVKAAKEVGLKVLRIFLPDLFEPYPGQYNEALFRKLDYILYLCRQNGIAVNIALKDNCDAYGWVGRWWDAFPATRGPYAWFVQPSWPPNTSNYTDPAAKRMFKEYIRYVVTRKNTYTGIRYCDDPTIFVWELANEPSYPKHPGDPEQMKYWNRWLRKKYGTEEALNKEWVGSSRLKPGEKIGNIPIPSEKEMLRDADFKEFQAQMHNDWGWELSSFIQQLDPNHLVNRNIGDWWWHKDDSYNEQDPKHLIDEHSYGINFADLIEHHYKCARRAHLKYHRPFILGEFGQPVSYPARYNLFELYKEIMLNFRISGIQFWNWGLAHGIVNCDFEPYSDVWEIFPWAKEDRWHTLKLIELIKDTARGCE